MKEGVWISNPSQIKKEFLNFFKEKFKDHDSNVDFPMFANSSRLCTLDRDSSETHVSLDEVKNAVQDCGSSKAPGPDGFSYAFVKKYWDYIKVDILDNTPIDEKIDKIERQIRECKLRFVDDEGNPLVPTGIADSDCEVEVVFDETDGLRLSTTSKDGSDKGYGTNSLLEQWRDSYPDNDDYDPYDDDMYENHDMSEHLQSICDDLDIMTFDIKEKELCAWASRFLRFLDNRREEGVLMRNSIDNERDQYFADIKVMNYILQGIPNDIYNFVDTCGDAQGIWNQIKRLMQGTNISKQERHSWLMNEFYQFVAEAGESLTYVYERFSTLINNMDQNEAKKAVRNHDPLALVLNSYANPSHSHASPSYSHSPPPYYVTRPPSVQDYDDDYQGEIQRDDLEDKLSTIMMLLARAITQHY
ncbi:hypothetical protein Tco_0926989 [Tanacetum coccineum]|uniref:Uncharacterized protein n=1 Tax=Tanacetum coccineum TaxID=301880 RepID=A0ABQ5DBG0_9ASTR